MNSNQMISLVYVSSSRTRMSPPELLAIVDHSKKFNSAHGITGMLLHRDGSFMQVLEGPAPEVSALMNKISRDSRHSCVLELLRRPIAETQFSEWSMGFRDLNTLSASELQTFAPYLSDSLTGDSFPNEPTAALKLLQFFKNNMR